MERRVLVLALAAAAAAGGAGIFVMRRSHPPPTASSTVSAVDSTWCGSPLSDGAGDTSDCGKMSITGSAPQCLFWAECGASRFELDCISAGTGNCRCGARVVPYDPAFCALDPREPKRSLRAVLDTAARACAWPTAK